jgi:hypothetical protein
VDAGFRQGAHQRLSAQQQLAAQSMWSRGAWSGNSNRDGGHDEQLRESELRFGIELHKVIRAVHVASAKNHGVVGTVGGTAWASDGGVASVGNARSECGAWHAVLDLPRWALGQAKPGGFESVSNGPGLLWSYGPGLVNPFQIFQRLS